MLISLMSTSNDLAPTDYQWSAHVAEIGANGCRELPTLDGRLQSKKTKQTTATMERW
jgi:hypothetical protein